MHYARNFSFSIRLRNSFRSAWIIRCHSNVVYVRYLQYNTINWGKFVAKVLWLRESSSLFYFTAAATSSTSSTRVIFIFGLLSPCGRLGKSPTYQMTNIMTWPMRPVFNFCFSYLLCNVKMGEILISPYALSIFPMLCYVLVTVCVRPYYLRWDVIMPHHFLLGLETVISTGNILSQEISSLVVHVNCNKIPNCRLSKGSKFSESGSV